FGAGPWVNAAAFSIGNKGYVGTGGAQSNQLWAYDAGSDSWSQKANFAGTGRIYAVGFSIGDMGYIGTGDTVGAGVNGLKDCWKFAPEETDTIFAAFSASNQCLEMPVEFLDESTTSGANEIVEWSWDFGDGNISSTQNPQHTYTSPGTFTVKLMVTDDMQNMDSVEHSVTIHPMPIVDFNYYYIDTLTIQFIGDSPHNAGEYYWWFGDGDTSVISEPVHQFAMPAYYEVCFSAYNSQGCEGKECKQINVVTLNVSEHSPVRNLKIYPNPTQDKLFISGEMNASKGINIKLLNIQGQVVYTEFYYSEGNFIKEIPVSQFSAGMYFLEMENTSGIMRQKLVIK
ncbi:MAG: PKD domain-containing protein, partial [Bacteroidetes bacterium]|nr:PKD domain-containing protein [Bacteroidota bacterium]